MVQRSYDIDSKLYTDFRTICVSENSTATQVIQELISGYVSENKDKVYIKSEETKYRLNMPKLYDENYRWNKFLRYASNPTFLDIWYRLTFLHSLATRYAEKENMELDMDFQLFRQQNPFEKTLDYKFLKNQHISVVGITPKCLP